MPLPGNPPATTTPAAFKTWAQNVVDTLNDIIDGTIVLAGDDETYDATTWNDSTEVPTKNAVRDKIESVSADIAGILDGATFTGDVVVPTEVYGAGWNGSNEVPTKDALYDKIETLGAGGGGGSETALFIPASAFIPTSGSPILGEAGTSNAGGYLFDAATTEHVWTAARIPQDWVTYNIELWWMNAGAGAGNVVWFVDYNAGFGDAESTDAGTTGTQRTVAAPAGAVAEVTTMDSGLTVPASGELVALRARRVGGDGSDTLANDACMLGLRLVMAS